MRYIQLMVPMLGRQTLWLLLAFCLTLGVGENIAIAVDEPLPPPNNMFNAATPISLMTGTSSGTTIAADAEPGEPAHTPDNSAHHSIWYEWTAPDEVAEIYFYTLGSSFDTVLAIYTGSSVDNLNPVVSNDDDVGVVTSKVKFTPKPGAIYYIAIDGYAEDDVYELDKDFGLTFLHWVPVSDMVIYTLVVQKTGNGTGTVAGGGPFDEGTMTQISATAATGSTFTGWSEDCIGTASPLSVLMNANKTCTATFTLNTYTLAINPGGSGTGTVAGGGTFYYGTTQEITATAAGDSTFTGWSGACTGTASPLSVLINADKTCTATFNLNTDTRTLTVSQTGTGTGRVAGGGTYIHGTTQEISVTAADGSTFIGWSGDCTGTDNPLSVLMNEDKTCSATLTLNTHTLTVNKTGSGTVTSAPTGIVCGDDCSEVYDFSDQVTLTATPDTNNTFVGWSGGNCTGTQDCTVTIMDANITITAIFEKNFPWPMFLPAIIKRVE